MNWLVLVALTAGPDPIGPEMDAALGLAPKPTCAPALSRYPVAGPHNGGWDKQATRATCPPHPTEARDNTDFGRPRHGANDLFAATGTPVVAAAAGTVVALVDAPVTGLGVVIRDACGWHHLYAHLSKLVATKGQNVRAGDVLGAVGRTGGAARTAPHLHFSLFPERYAEAVDPYPALRKVDETACGR